MNERGVGVRAECLLLRDLFADSDDETKKGVESPSGELS